ncbi:MAG: hypothetical protein KAW52_01440 [candidate division Zixibacteria bacterium]|nr:hypothetical protein [candidate division Zixibacteria bacterium]
MDEKIPNSNNSSNRPRNEIETLYDRVIEFHKSGMTIGLALLLGMVTVTGFAVQTDRAQLFLVAAVIPVFAFVIDLLVKRNFIAPFLYKAMSLEMEQNQGEPMGLLLLEFGIADESRLLQIFRLPSGPTRQREFLKAYMRKKLVLKIMFYGSGVLGEITLWIFAIPN